MEEFKLALQYFTLLGSSTLEITSNIEDNDSNNDNIGEYKGDILQYPELLWTEVNLPLFFFLFLLFLFLLLFLFFLSLFLLSLPSLTFLKG